MSLRGPCRWCGHSGEEKMFCPWQELNPWTSSPQPSHSLYWLCYPSFITTSNCLTSFQVYGVEFSMVYTLDWGGLHFHSVRLHCLCLTSLSVNTVPGQCYNTALGQWPGWSTVLDIRPINSYCNHCEFGNIFSIILLLSITKIYYTNNLYHHILGQWAE
jgi:hypothetical protein